MFHSRLVKNTYKQRELDFLVHVRSFGPSIASLSFVRDVMHKRHGRDELYNTLYAGVLPVDQLKMMYYKFLNMFDVDDLWDRPFQTVVSVMSSKAFQYEWNIASCIVHVHKCRLYGRYATMGECSCVRKIRYIQITFRFFYDIWDVN